MILSQSTVWYSTVLRVDDGKATLAWVVPTEGPVAWIELEGQSALVTAAAFHTWWELFFPL